LRIDGETDLAVGTIHRGADADRAGDPEPAPRKGAKELAKRTREPRRLHTVSVRRTRGDDPMAKRLPAPFHYAAATSVTTEPDGTVAVRYHRTDVATLHPDGTVTLRTGGWRTVTTRRRINQALRYFGVPTVVY